METFFAILIGSLELGVPAVLLLVLWRIWPREEKAEGHNVQPAPLAPHDQTRP